MKKLATLTAAAALVAAFGFATNAMAVTLVVNDDENGDGAVDEVAPPCVGPPSFDDDGATRLTSIQDAIERTIPTAADIIIVCPGVYEENVVVDIPNLILIGRKGPVLGPCLVGVEEPTQACVVAGTGEDAITITANGVMVLGFKVTGIKDEFGDPLNNDGIHVLGIGSTLIKNTAFDNGNHGIFIASGSTGNVVEGNNMHDNGTGNEGDGINVDSDSGGNVIFDNKSHDNFDDGFDFEFAGNTVNGNRSNDNFDCGYEGVANYNTTEDKEGRNRANKNDGGNFCAEAVGGLGSIEGRVTDDTEDNLAKAVVTTDTDPPLSDTTGGSGKYFIRAVPAGPSDVTVTATCKNGTGGVVTTVIVEAGESAIADFMLTCL